MQLTNLISRIGMKSAADRIISCPLLDSAIGAGICGLAALAASTIALGHTWRNTVPLVFILVLLVIARFFGYQAGIMGTVLAALIFASFLFSPLGHITVSSDSARSNLGWMLLIGIAFSFLFAPSRSGFRRN